MKRIQVNEGRMQIRDRGIREEEDGEKDSLVFSVRREENTRQKRERKRKRKPRTTDHRTVNIYRSTRIPRHLLRTLYVCIVGKRIASIGIRIWCGFELLACIPEHRVYGPSRSLLLFGLSLTV